ncbi:putative serine/threonine-protein kinase-like protein CCR3 [Salvia hispanica]|uniref:putative serine/threonine-protein kinase-like protein CCR3 n=1 Tax=Salvia hispanica TaxID=49212 RepID=UPI0020094390|nr:putative serine/threonine-protein kinase-like protein CCR3 [Salvia hispanica]XP_047953911.1 putative serine/threonine-protein kinase-like protein CCR3 [Salvia hispanica]
MTRSFLGIISATILLLFSVIPPPPASALGGSGATIAAVYGSSTTVCSIAAEQAIQQIQCWRDGQLLPPILPTVSFDYLAGGRDTLCAVRSGGLSLLCWNTTFAPKRIYNTSSAPLTSLAIGDAQICALRNTTSDSAICWRGNSVQFPDRFRMISSGLRFSCGVTETTNRVLCWGDGGGSSSSVQLDFANLSMFNIHVGGNHACGIDVLGIVICKGSNDTGQLNIPANTSGDYRDLALGASHTCAITRSNGSVVCWGGDDREFSSSITDGISFESIVAGFNFTCGLTRRNFSVVCWGAGWPTSANNLLPLQKTLPGPCVQTPCSCGEYPDYETLCVGDGHICAPCDPISADPALPPPRSTSPSRGLRRGLLAFAIVGSVGGFAGICSVVYCLWRSGVCFGKKKVHNSVQPTITNSGSNPPSRSSTLRRQASILMRRQRSGTSSKQHADKAAEFLFSDLAEATRNFAAENRIGAGSFGVVYRGKLPNGREVAIKRSESGSKAKKFQEKENAFESEISFLSRLHHKHLVKLVGYCEEKEERLLVYDFMKNGALYDHLHSKSNVEKSSSVINSWRMRIKIALDAARGVEYLHSYAVPPIIHRDIKSSNILLDASWTARVSDFGLSLMGPEDERDYRPMKAAGTVGYIDPEYYGLNVLTVKSDVYGFGVVLLELLTGKRAIFKNADEGGAPVSVVDYAVPAIMAGEVGRILDRRVGAAEVNEMEAVELVAYTARHCVHLEGKDRPSMSDIIINLDRALGLCEESHGSISSGTISIASD